MKTLIENKMHGKEMFKRQLIKKAIINRGNRCDHDYINFEDIVKRMRYSSKNLLKIMLLDWINFDMWVNGDVFDVDRTHRFLEDIDIDLFPFSKIQKYYNLG